MKKPEDETKQKGRTEEPPPVTEARSAAPPENCIPHFDKEGRLCISKKDLERWCNGVRKKGDNRHMKVVYLADLGGDRILNLGCSEGQNSRRPLMFNEDGCLIMSETDFQSRWRNKDDGKQVRVIDPGGDKIINIGCEEPGPGGGSDELAADDRGTSEH